MYKSRQCTYSNANQVWGNGQWFERANDDTVPIFPTKEATCLSIDEDDTDTDFSRSKQQWRDPLRLRRSIDGNKDADKFNSEYKNNIPLKTSRQCLHAHGKKIWGNGQFQQANDDTDIKFFLRVNNNEKSHLLSLSWWYQRCGQVQ